MNRAALLTSLIVNLLLAAALLASCFWKPELKLTPTLDLSPTPSPCHEPRQPTTDSNPIATIDQQLHNLLAALLQRATRATNADS